MRTPWSLVVLLLSLVVAGVWCAELDANVYAKVFEVNQPAWVKLAALIERNVPAGSTVLDIGAGPGEPTATMAKKLPDHKFMLTDKQAPMLEKARVRVEGLANVQMEVASAEDLSKFSDESFHAATGCYVLMFVDVEKALRETARVLKPGGLAYFTVWNEVLLYSLLRESLTVMYRMKGWKGDPPKTPVNPMSLAPDVGESEVDQHVPQDLGLTMTGQEIITYPMNMGGNMQETCKLSFMLGTPFDKIAEEHEMTEDEVKKDFCDVFQQVANAREDVVTLSDGSVTLGQGNATIYSFQKDRRKAGELRR